VLREWPLRGGRLRYGVTTGLLFGIGMGVVFYWVGSSRSAVGAAVGGVVVGAWFGTVMAVSRYAGGLLSIRELAELPPSERVAVLRVVRRGEPVTDPLLAPAVLACTKSVMMSQRRLQSPRWRWMFFVFAALQLVLAITKTSTGPVWLAVFFWAAAVMFFGAGWAWPRELERGRHKAQAAADYATELIGRSSDEHP